MTKIFSFIFNLDKTSKIILIISIMLLPTIYHFKNNRSYALDRISSVGEKVSGLTPWYKNAQKILKANDQINPNRKKAKNIIFFVGDGMSVGTVTAARILDGQLRGEEGEENLLIWEKFPHISLSKTYNTNQQTPDSAGTASAFMTGYKTSAGVISVAENVKINDCLAAQKYPLTSFLEIAENNGLHTGIISTARITHATPATSYAHSPSRGWENNSKLPSKAKEQGCIDIAQQLVNFNIGDGIDLVFGGGRQNFLPTTDLGPEGEKGKRTDKKNLIKEWQDKHEDGYYVWNNKGFNAIPDDTDQPIFGLFNPSHMQYSADRDKSENGEPSLAEMTEKAIKIMKNKDGGYFLFIEAGRIDHGHHANSGFNALHDTVALARAVEKAVKMTDSEETLIIVTADHSHGFVMGGYSKKGNSILGKVMHNAEESHTDGDLSEDIAHLAKDKMPYTTIGYYGGISAEISAGRKDLKDIDTAAKTYKQQALVPLRSGSHSTEDVPIYAVGPSAYLFRGVVEQNYIFHVMMHAMRMETDE